MRNNLHSSIYNVKLLAVVMSVILVVSTVLATGIYAAGLTKEYENDLVARITGRGLDGKPVAVTTHVQPQKCRTAEALEYLSVRNELSPLARTTLSAAFARPSLPSAYLSAGGHFVIHYSSLSSDSNAVYQPGVDIVGALGASGADGIPDYVNRVGDIFDSVYVIQLGDSTLGNLEYPLPPDDSTYGGDSNSRIDIYLVETGGSYYGATYPETFAPHFRNLNFPIDSDTGAAYTSFILIDNDYQEAPFSSVNDYQSNPLNAVRVTAAHEFFHIIHFGIDATEVERSSLTDFQRPYWYEIAAVSMEEYVYDNINDYYGYLIFPDESFADPFSSPHKSIQTAGGGKFSQFHYAMGVFGIYLNQKYGPLLMREIWKACWRPGPSFLRAIDSVLLARTSNAFDFGKCWQEFGIWTVFTGKRAKFAPVGRGFDEGINYPEIPDTLQDQLNYPFLVLANQQSPAPESNGRSYAFMKNTVVLGNDCIKLFTVSPDIYLQNGVFPRTTVIGIPYDGVSPAYIDTTTQVYPLVSDTVKDSLVSAPTAQFDAIFASTRSYFVSTYACSDNYFNEFPFLDTLAGHGNGRAAGSIRALVIRDAPAIRIPNAAQYDPIVLMVTPTSTDFRDFGTAAANPSKYPYAFGTGIAQSISLDSSNTSPYDFFAPFPNPILPSNGTVTLGAAKKRTDFGLSRTIRAVVYSESGEKIFERFTPAISSDSVKIEWNLRNPAGKSISSGVYIVLQELLGPTGNIEISQKSKIAVIR